MRETQTGLLACVEVGGSGSQTIVFGDDTMLVMDGAHQPAGAQLALAVPGLLNGHRVAAASNLGWIDVDPVEALGLRGPAEVVCNDAEAAAIGEAALRELAPGDILAFVGMGTGVGGAVVAGDTVVASNLFGHGPLVGDLECRCGRLGCLETVAGGWALPSDLGQADLARVADAVARAIDTEPAAAGALVVVVAGGIAVRYPELVGLIDGALPDRRVEPSAAPGSAKSAAAWGLRQLVTRRSAMSEGGRS
jgi:predicted NBD/HSP70 family sugar kinase